MTVPEKFDEAPKGYMKLSDAIRQAVAQGASGGMFYRATGGNRMVFPILDDVFTPIEVKGTRYVKEETLKHLDMIKTSRKAREPKEEKGGKKGKANVRISKSEKAAIRKRQNAKKGIAKAAKKEDAKKGPPRIQVNGFKFTQKADGKWHCVNFTDHAPFDTQEEAKAWALSS